MKCRQFDLCFIIEYKTAAEDAYSFVDEEEESKPLPSGAVLSVTQLREQKLEAEVAQKVARINHALATECKAKAVASGSSEQPQSQQDLWRHVVPKKRHSVATERPLVPSTPLLPPASVSEHRPDNTSSSQKAVEPQTISSLLLHRSQHRSSFGFLKTLCLDDHDTAKSEQQMGEPSVITISNKSKENNRAGNE
ncbi:unnamed protein product [Gongylonema pulchrum]|uniref:SARAH domain-containing protein n=1 Tax=Gongylonema pulchrum TaxID=637853 RepID=A0A183EBA3_9BILA|nr:unnamed protein product [Gongylonema pulchrum]